MGTCAAEPRAHWNLLSPDRIRQLLCEVSPLSMPARKLLRSLVELGAFGPDRAITQSRIAVISGIPARRIQQVNLELLEHGVVVCTSCTGAMGEFIATTVEQVAPFRDQLAGRAKLCFLHIQALDRAVRLASAAIAAERDGEGTLFASNPRA